MTGIAGTVNTTFSYDANGNLRSSKNRTLTWSSFNMPVNIRQGGQDATFLYDFDHRRAKQTAPDGTETYYVNAFGIHYEKEVRAGVTEFKHTLVAGGQTIGEVVTVSGGASRTVAAATGGPSRRYTPRQSDSRQQSAVGRRRLPMTSETQVRGTAVKGATGALQVFREHGETPEWACALWEICEIRGYGKLAGWSRNSPSSKSGGCDPAG